MAWCPLTFTAVPDSDIKLVGAEIKYAFASGKVALPALAIRAAWPPKSTASKATRRSA